MHRTPTAEFAITVNEAEPARKFVVPAGKTITVSVPLPAATTNLSVRYTGAKGLVLLQTAFA